MNFTVFECEQGSEEWHACRLGIPTASEFKTVMATGRGGGESATRAEYMRKLIGERLTGKPMYRWTNEHMERGQQMEDEARQLYAMIAEVEPRKVGFIRNDALGCGASPDSLIGDEGLLEIKTALPHIQIERLLRLTKFPPDRHLPPEHVCQVQGQLWMSGRKWCDFISYWPGIRLFRVRVERDETVIDDIAQAVDLFNSELLATMAKVAA